MVNLNASVPAVQHKGNRILNCKTTRAHLGENPDLGVCWFLGGAELMFSVCRGDRDQGRFCFLPPPPSSVSLCCSFLSPFLGTSNQMETSLRLLVGSSFLQRWHWLTFCYSENIWNIMKHLYTWAWAQLEVDEWHFLVQGVVVFFRTQSWPSLWLWGGCALTDGVGFVLLKICLSAKSQRTLSQGMGPRLGIRRCALRHGHRCDWQ